MKTTKSFGKKVDTLVDRMYKLQEEIEDALNEYDEYELEHDGLSEKQEENREALQEEYDELQNSIDYIEMFTSENL